MLDILLNITYNGHVIVGNGTQMEVDLQQINWAFAGVSGRRGTLQ